MRTMLDVASRACAIVSGSRCALWADIPSNRRAALALRWLAHLHEVPERGNCVAVLRHAEKLSAVDALTALRDVPQAALFQSRRHARRFHQRVRRGVPLV